MKHVLFLSCLFAAVCMASEPPTAVTTESTGKVTISSRGQDVREVLHDLFKQARRDFVIEDAQRVNLFLALNDADFDEALAIVCNLGGLRYEIQNGICFIRRAPTKSVTADAPKPADPSARPKGTLPATALQKRVTTRLSKTALRDVLNEFARQTGIMIELDPSVPAYKLDAVLVDMSLQSALERVTKAANLGYRLTDRMSILVFPTDPNRVSISTDSN